MFSTTMVLVHLGLFGCASRDSLISVISDAPFPVLRRSILITDTTCPRPRPVFRELGISLRVRSCDPSPFFSPPHSYLFGLAFPNPKFRIQKCRKICGIGCVNQACTRARVTQPSPHIFLHICRPLRLSQSSAKPLTMQECCNSQFTAPSLSQRESTLVKVKIRPQRKGCSRDEACVSPSLPSLRQIELTV